MKNNKYEEIRQKVAKDYKDRLDEKDHKIILLCEKIKDLEKENIELKRKLYALENKSNRYDHLMTAFADVFSMLER